MTLVAQGLKCFCWLFIHFTNLIYALDMIHIKTIKKFSNTVNRLHVEVSFQRCLLEGLSELSVLSDRHYFFITRYSMKEGNVLQTAGCTQSVSTFICKQHSAEGAATHRRSIIFHSYHSCQTDTTL